jgi:hypothetical protein
MARSRSGPFSPISSNTSRCMSQPPNSTSTHRTPASTNLRASRQPWPAFDSPYLARTSGFSLEMSNACRSTLPSSRTASL